MGREAHDHRPSRHGRQLLLDLGRVTVARDAVGLHVLVRLGVEVHRVDLAPLRAGACHAGLAVDDDPLRQPPSALEQRRDGEHSTHRVTPWRGDERRPRDGLPVKLGQPVHCVPQSLGILVRALVPGCVERGVGQPVIGGEVDGLPTEPPQRGYDALGFHVGQREEDEVRRVRKPLAIELREDEVTQAPQMREDAVQPFARRAVPRSPPSSAPSGAPRAGAAVPLPCTRSPPPPQL